MGPLLIVARHVDHRSLEGVGGGLGVDLAVVGVDLAVEEVIAHLGRRDSMGHPRRVEGQAEGLGADNTHS